MQWAAAAAVLIIVQGVSLGLIMTSGQQQIPRYLTASGPAQSVTGTFAMVHFAQDASADDISRLLAEFEIAIVDGPGPGSVCKIGISDKKLDEAAREALLTKLQTYDNVIAFAAPIE